MNIKELLSPDIDLSLLQAKAEELFAAIENKKRNLNNAPEGRLRIAERKTGAYFFHVTESSSQWGDYLARTESKAIAQLAQKEYDRAVLAEMQRELNAINRFLKSYHPTELHKIYSGMTEIRKSYVRPIYLPDEVYAERWLSVKYTGKAFATDAPQLFTSRGERVRSKSEVIIADTLVRLGIPYRYEFPHELKVCCRARDYDSRGGEDCGKRNRNGSRRGRISAVFYPDFTCLNLRTRREFIWEHFGLMSDSEYAANASEKLETYCDNGIFPGDGLLITMETQERPLNPATAEAIAKKYLL
ncbi:hypothetical protein [Fibrobacter sp.]|uniref:hypothetical protein n=1 Tax=Fibrobacter sp. TaxID=35828 RepID=UPI00388E18D7